MPLRQAGGRGAGGCPSRRSTPAPPKWRTSNTLQGGRVTESSSCEGGVTPAASPTPPPHRQCHLTPGWLGEGTEAPPPKDCFFNCDPPGVFKCCCRRFQIVAMVAALTPWRSSLAPKYVHLQMSLRLRCAVGLANTG